VARFSEPQACAQAGCGLDRIRDRGVLFNSMDILQSTRLVTKAQFPAFKFLIFGAQRQMTNDPSPNDHPVGTANAIGWRVGSLPDML
jgi:hypothetical protein